MQKVRHHVDVHPLTLEMYITLNVQRQIIQNKEIHKREGGETPCYMDAELDSEARVFGESSSCYCSWLDEEIGSLNVAFVLYCQLFFPHSIKYSQQLCLEVCRIMKSLLRVGVEESVVGLLVRNTRKMKKVKFTNIDMSFKRK